MYESPSTIPRHGALRSGSGPRKPHELVVWVDPLTISAPVPVIDLGGLGVSGT